MLFRLFRSTSTIKHYSTLHSYYSTSPTRMLPTITLTPSEQKLATLLVQCADWVDQNPSEVDKLRLKDEDGQWIGKLRGNEKIELRIAGGWVRDKVRRRRFE